MDITGRRTHNSLHVSAAAEIIASDHDIALNEFVFKILIKVLKLGFFKSYLLVVLWVTVDQIGLSN